MRIIPWFIGILALSAVMAQLPVQESPVTAQAPVAQGSNNCSPGCYRCYSYSVCYECYSGYYLSNAKCYRQSGSNSSGGVSWLFIICCILCCGGCCFGAARYAETHGHELHDHRETDYHHHTPCPHENDHRREMQDMTDPYGNPMMAGANLHGYNPPAHHMHGQPYVPPPPIQGMPAPYGYGPSVGFDSHNHPISSGYTPPPMTNYTYGAPADGLHINQQPQRGLQPLQNTGSALPPGFLGGPSPYPNTSQPGARDSQLPADHKGFSYPSQVDQKSPGNTDSSKAQYESVLVAPKKDDSPGKAKENEKNAEKEKLVPKVTQSEILPKTEKQE